MKYIGQFFALTTSGMVWEARRRGGEIEEEISLKVIAQKRRGSIKADTELGLGYRVLGVTINRGICCYNPPVEIHSPKGYLKTPTKSGKRCLSKAKFTNPICMLALNLSLEEIDKILKMNIPFQPWDWRFLENTMQVLEAIEADDQQFSVDDPVRRMMFGPIDYVRKIVCE